jgi:opacity protein-like surface antigen
MKKILFVTIAILGLSNVYAQEEFASAKKEIAIGIKAGYNSFIARASFGGTTSSASVSGYYAGLFADITTSEKFHIQPELFFAQASQDGDSGNMLILPIMGKYYIIKQLNIQVGPQLDYILDDSEGIKKLGIGLGAGLAYDINKSFLLEARYSFGLTNRLEDLDLSEIDPILSGFDIKSKFNFFQIGVGYRF